MTILFCHYCGDDIDDEESAFVSPDGRPYCCRDCMVDGENEVADLRATSQWPCDYPD